MTSALIGLQLTKIELEVYDDCSVCTEQISVERIHDDYVLPCDPYGLYAYVVSKPTNTQKNPARYDEHFICSSKNSKVNFIGLYYAPGVE